jgi:TIR domain.
LKIKKKLFLSHSSKDKPFAHGLRTDLSYYQIQAWLDEPELYIGDSLTKCITEAIIKSEHIGIVFSSHSIYSEWVKEEIRIAQAYGKPVFPIVLEHVSVPENFPFDLNDHLYADFSAPKFYASSFQRLLKLLGHKMPLTSRFSIFSGISGLGWENASWDCEYDENCNRFHAGQQAIRIRMQAFGGVAFSFWSGIDTTGYKACEFYINGGEEGGQCLKVYINVTRGNGVRRPVSIPKLCPNKWERITISLRDLEAENIAFVKFNLSDTSGNDSPDLYLANICLVK